MASFVQQPSTAQFPALRSSNRNSVPLIVFIVVLAALVIEIQLTQYVQTTLEYRHPYFIFYITQAGSLFVLPAHALLLLVTTRASAQDLLHDLSRALSYQLTSTHHARFPLGRFFILVLALTAGLSIPALLWFASVSLASVGDVTAIWNANAFFTYLITVILFKLEWVPHQLIAVSMATLGVLSVIYGGASSSPSHTSDFLIMRTHSPSNPILGDFLAFVASVGYGLYQVLYSKYVALRVPCDDQYLLPEEVDAQIESTPMLSPKRRSYPLPFGLYANTLTSSIGLCTLLLLWIPIPINHVLGVEKFVLPNDASTLIVLLGITLCDVVSVGGYMILLGVWGPIVTSVGGLLTIVLVFISDMVFGDGLNFITPWSLVGAGMIILAFGGLAHEVQATTPEDEASLPASRPRFF